MTGTGPTVPGMGWQAAEAKAASHARHLTVCSGHRHGQPTRCLHPAASLPGSSSCWWALCRTSGRRRVPRQQLGCSAHIPGFRATRNQGSPPRFSRHCPLREAGVQGFTCPIKEEEADWLLLLLTGAEGLVPHKLLPLEEGNEPWRDRGSLQLPLSSAPRFTHRKRRCPGERPPQALE